MPLIDARLLHNAGPAEVSFAGNFAVGLCGGADPTEGEIPTLVELPPIPAPPSPLFLVAASF
jgi:hypothetical protein